MSTEMSLIKDELEAIKIMLEAYHRSSNDYQWIEGYVVGAAESEGANGERGVYVHLYGIGEKMKDPCVKVYGSEKKVLPYFIQSAVDWNNPDKYQILSAKGAEKANATKKGIYVIVPRFSIVRYNGKDTSMGPQKHMCGVVEWSKEARDAERAALGRSQSQPQPVQKQSPQVTQAKQPQAVQAIKSQPSRWDSPVAAVDWAFELDMVGVKKFETRDSAQTYYSIKRSEWKPDDAPSMYDQWFIEIHSVLFIKWAMQNNRFAEESDAVAFANNVFSGKRPESDADARTLLRQALSAKK